MGDKRMIVKNIYQKLHQACLSAGGVKERRESKRYALQSFAA